MFVIFLISVKKLQIKVHTLTHVVTIPAGQSWQRWTKRQSPKITACEHTMGNSSRISSGKGELTTGPSGPMFCTALGIHAFTEHLLVMRRVD